MKTSEIAKRILESNFEFIGIRHLADDEEYSVGDICRNSYDWDYEYDCSSYGTENEVELDGTCAYDTKIDKYIDEQNEIEEKLKKALDEAPYCGSAIIIGGNRIEYGADENEIIIRNAEVIACM